MLRATGFVLGSILILLVACQRAEEAGPATSDVGAAAAPVLSGSWRVEGVTVEKASGRTRQITGIVILHEEGGKYRSTFDLDTMLPTEGGPTHADVIGEGEGSIENRVITGTSRTQIVVAGAPKLDPGFAFVPRHIGSRIVNATTGALQDDGTILLEIESEPAPGEDYSATTTTLRGVLTGPPP